MQFNAILRVVHSFALKLHLLEKTLSSSNGLIKSRLQCMLCLAIIDRRSDLDSCGGYAQQGQQGLLRIPAAKVLA